MRAAVQPLDLADAGMIRACYETHVAAMAADDPFEPPVSLAIFTLHLRAGPFEPPREAWYVPAEADGAVAAWYQAEFPDPENRDRVWLTLTVHPARRRAGLGTALLRHAAERAAAAGRAILDGGGREGGGGRLLAGALDRRHPRRPARPGSVAAQRDERRAHGPRRRGHGVDGGAGPRPHERPDRALPVPAVLAGGGARRQRRDGGADRGVGRPRHPRLGAPADHRGDQAAPRPPARHADQGGDDGLAGRGRARDAADRDLERRGQPVHDRGERGARLRGGGPALPVGRAARLVSRKSLAAAAASGCAASPWRP